MSHLKHISELKQALDTLGITCPFKQQELAMEAYFRAILVSHFRYNTSLSMTEDQSQRCWKQLDKWNCVSPIKAQLIMTKVATFLNSLRNSLGNRGVSLEEEPSLELPDGTKQCLCSLDTFNDLVQYLAKEMREGNE